MITFQEYMQRVFRVMKTKGVNQKTAYEEIELWHMETFGSERFTTYDSFRSKKHTYLNRKSPPGHNRLM